MGYLIWEKGNRRSKSPVKFSKLIYLFTKLIVEQILDMVGNFWRVVSKLNSDKEFTVFLLVFFW